MFAQWAFQRRGAENAEISAEKTGLLSNDDIVSGAAAS